MNCHDSRISLHLELNQVDVETNFLNNDLQIEIFMTQLKGYGPEGK